VTEYQATARDHAIMIAIGWGLPFGLVAGLLTGLVLDCVRRKK